MTPIPGNRSPRATPRVPVRLAVELYNLGDPFPAYTVNLGRGGMLVRGDFPPLVEHPIKLTLQSPAHDFSIPLRARLCRLQRGPQPTLDDLAVEFVDLSSFQRNSLDRLVRRAQEGTFGLPVELLASNPGSRASREALKDVALRDRIALALRGDRPTRAHLVHDMNPRVIDALVRNSRLDGLEARILIRRRDITPASVRRLASNPRFLQDQEILRALLAHPRADTQTIERTIEHARPEDLREAITRSSISDATRRLLVKALSDHARRRY